MELNCVPCIGIALLMIRIVVLLWDSLVYYKRCYERHWDCTAYDKLCNAME